MPAILISSLSKLERLVVTLVGEQSRRSITYRDVADLDLSEAGELFQISQANEVECHVGHALGDLGIELPSAWQAAHQETAQRIASYLRELDVVADALADAGIPLVALKNAGIARALHSCPGCCPMGDLDALVRLEDFRQAHRLLVARGFEFEFRSPLESAQLDAAELGGGTEYWRQLEDGSRLWFELQWRPIAGRWLRPDQEPSADELIERSVAVKDGSVRLLSPEDNLLQVAVHTAKHSYVRAPGFRLHTDVDRIVNAQAVDWESFVANVVRRQLKTAVYFSLLIPSQLFGTPIPADVLAELRPAGWKVRQLSRQILQAGLLDPHRPKFGKLAYIGFHALLYDDMRGLCRSVFPAANWMQQRYQTAGWGLYVAYLRRLGQLAFHRNPT